MEVESVSQTIKLLPEHLIDQIKAGEVVERPASLIKELVENSIDAGSSKISIAIKEGGMDLISIEDDGKGMTFSDLPYAFCRHATSKIEKFEDLYGLNSFGFRGEALPSIASVSRLVCTSTPKNKEEGGRLVINGGRTESHTSFHNSSKGTSFFVRDLFFNTPARMKFVKSAQAEKKAIKKILHSFILSNPSITFSIKWDDKEKEIYPALSKENLNKRIEQLWFKKNEDEKGLFEFNGEYEGYRFKGFCSIKSSKGNSGKSQFIFVNKRMIFDKALHSCLTRTMEPVWGIAQSGHYFISLEIPPNKVDVNVHPNKTEIRFLKSSIVYSLVTSSIKKGLSQRIQSPLDFQGQGQDNNFNSELPQFPMQNSFEPMENSVSEEIGPNLFQLTDNYLIFKDKNQACHLLDLELFIREYICDYFKSSFPIAENELTPLLISEPFQLPMEMNQFFPFLKNLGFNFEFIDDETVVLRTYPERFNFLAIRNFSEFLLGSLDPSLNGNLKKWLSSLKKSLKLSDLKIHKNILPDYLENSSKKYSIILDQNKIDSFFQMNGLKD